MAQIPSGEIIEVPDSAPFALSGGCSSERNLRSTPQRTQPGVPWTPATYTPPSTTALLARAPLLEANTYYCLPLCSLASESHLLARPSVRFADHPGLSSSMTILHRSAQDLSGKPPVCDSYRRRMELAPRKDVQFAAFPASSCGQLESCKDHSESSSLAVPHP